MECRNCLAIFERIGAALNSPLDTDGLIALIARTLSEEMHVAGCAIRLLSRDRKTLEAVASWGLSERFLQKGPIDAERSVAEAIEGRVVVIPDCRSDPRVQYPAAFAEEGLMTLLTVPLSTRGQVIGVLRLFCRERREFTPQDLEVIGVVAAYCAAALVHSMFHRIIEDASAAMRSSLELGTILESITRVITEDLRARGCVVELLDGGGVRLQVRGAFGVTDAFLAAAAGRTSGPIAAALAGAVTHVPDAGDSARVDFASAAAEAGVASILYVPLVIGGKVVGVMHVLTQRAYEFSEDEVYLLRGIADQLALAVRNAQMYAAVKDQFQDLAADFQRWFEEYQVRPASAAP
jgi:GAF domain-containing protein